MSRVTSTNYTAAGTPGSDFNYTDAANDPYLRAELQKLAKAMEFHDHANGRGLAVSRMAALALLESMIAAGAVTRDKIGWASIDGCRVFNNANLTLTTGVETALTFNSERYDVLGLHSTSSNTNRITVARAGLYLCFAAVAFASNATGRRSLSLRVNGTSYIASDGRNAVNGDLTYMALATVYQFVPTDYLEVTALQTSGGNLALTAGSLQGIEAGMNMIGAVS